VLLGVGLVRCAGPGYYLAALATLPPFVVIPVALGSVVTLVLVNVFPARRARDVLMLMGLLFAMAVVLLLRFIRPEQLMSVQSLPDVTGFFATLQSPITPLLPSFWAGETLFAALRGELDALHLGCLWTTALASVIVARSAYSARYFSGWSRAQEARKAGFSRLRFLDAAARMLPIGVSSRGLLLKDVRVFFRDTTQWSQLLLLVALMLVYLYNFRVLDLERVPYMSAVLKNTYAFVNLAMAAFVLAAVAVRFVFPSVSAEGAAFWIVRSSPLGMRQLVWSKFWTGLVPLLLMAEALTIASNELLGAALPLKLVAAAAVLVMTFALVGLATGMGARYPRFNAESLTQVAGSYGGVAFMVLAVLFIVVEIALLAWPASSYLWYAYRRRPIPPERQLTMALSAAAALGVACLTCWLPMRAGIRALEEREV
jgi:ABC-2 type transport system permease protein